MNEKFCPMPFGSLHIDPNGQIKICCSDSGYMTDDNGTILNVQTHTLDEAWNNKHIVERRQDFLQGKQPELCQACWESEIDGKGTSTRTGFIELYDLHVERKGYKIKDAVDDAIENNGYINNHSPVQIQVMSGNLCNLACKMCFPLYSNTWTKFYEVRDIPVKEIKYHKLQTSDPESLYQEFGHEYNWPKTVTMKKVFSTVADKLYHLVILGGEPTLLDENIEFIESLKYSANHNNLHLTVFTNTTNVNKRLLDSLSSFQDLQICSSLDGMDDIAYIQRTPSNWPQVYKNFKTLRKFALENKSHRRHGIVSVATALNLHHLGYFWNYMLTDRENYLNPEDISVQTVVQDFHAVGLGIVPKSVIPRIKEEFMQYESIKGSKIYNTMINYLDNMPWAEDNTAMLEMLGTVQRLHPELDIRKIYNIYYE